MSVVGWEFDITSTEGNKVRYTVFRGTVTEAELWLRANFLDVAEIQLIGQVKDRRSSPREAA